MILEYARYYMTFGLQLLTAYGVVRGGPYAWLGLSTLVVLALVDAVLPDDLAERHMRNRALANIPVWLCTVSGPLLILVLAWSVGQGHLAGWLGSRGCPHQRGLDVSHRLRAVVARTLSPA